MTSVVLLRANGSTTNYQQTFLENLAAHLLAGSQAYVEYDGVAFWRCGAIQLLLMDTAAPGNRQLLELYELLYDDTIVYGLAFRRDAATYDLLDALRSVGRPVPNTPTLETFFMARYTLGGGVYVEAGQLVLNSGVFGSRGPRSGSSSLAKASCSKRPPRAWSLFPLSRMRWPSPPFWGR
jgi:hypothetical protein